MKRLYLFLSGIFLVLLMCSSLGYAQVELVDADNPVYSFLQRMRVKQLVTGYNPANIPISRGEVAGFLEQLNEKTSRLSKTDRKILKYYYIEFQNEIAGSIKNSSSLFSDFDLEQIFDDKKEKYIYAYKDSNATLFVDAIGSLSQRGSSGDSLGSHSVLLGEGGFRVRGTLYNSLGYYLKATNTARLTGDSADFQFVRQTDIKAYANGNTFDFNIRDFYDAYQGYLRYQTPTNWLALSVGRYAVYQGAGYIDKLELSNNTVPFDFAKIDLQYKALSYSFMYGSLRGDSSGVELESKNIATHRLDVSFSNRFRFGFFESVIISNSPFSFTFLNPLSVLTSAELNKASQGDVPNINNTFLGFDAEVLPIRNVGVQGSIIIDDLDFSTLFTDSSGISNKFGAQVGTYWTDAFTVPDLTLKLEYTRLNPFVYAHKSNKAQYTHWGLPLGPDLEPNSDQVAVSLGYDFGSRLKMSLLYQMQRSANGFVLDSLGNIIINYGGDINNGIGEANRVPKFLDGNRINRDIVTFKLSWEPIRQYFFDFKFVYRMTNNLFENRKLTDRYFFATFRVDY